MLQKFVLTLIDIVMDNVYIVTCVLMQETNWQSSHQKEISSNFATKVSTE